MPKRSLLSLLLTLPLVGGEKDRLTLGNGDFFAGKVLALDDGLIELQSPHSDTPLKILNDDLVELSFAGPAEAEPNRESLPRDPQEVILENGDRFPGELIGLDDQSITFRTWFTGDLAIERPTIDALLFGVTPQKVVYRGPNEIEEWERGNERDWSARNDSLVANQRSAIGRNFDLPDNFIFRCRIGWDNSPNCRVHLCTSEPKLSGKNAGDSYLITLGSSGINLQRILIDDDGDPTYQTLISDSVKLRSRNSKSAELELRVARDTGMLHLYLDGEKTGQALDPSPPPAGPCILFESQSYSNGDMTVKDLTLEEWDTKTQRLRREPRAAEDLDTLVVADGDRFSGQITTFEPADSSFVLQSKLTPAPLSIPVKHCAMMYFARDEDRPPWKGRYQINLRVGGQLTVSKIKLGPKFLTATHPRLGSLKIDRRVMESITKS